MSARGSLALFFVLVFVVAIPFYIAGALTSVRLLPGLPVSALILICPTLAASIVMYREKGPAGVRALLKRSLDFNRLHPKTWLVPILFLMPAVTILEYVLMRALDLPLPAPHVSLQRGALLLAPLFVAALAEELGWSGYAIEALQARWNALTSALLLGSVWAVWHVVPLIQAGRSPTWIAWWSLGTVALRVLMTWLYSSAGRSVFGAALFHSTINLSWQMFPNDGSHWDPRLNAILISACAIAVTLICGPRKLAPTSRL